MAALVEVAPPAPALTLVEPAADTWTDDEISQAVELATAAARALWELADWLLDRLPMGRGTASVEDRTWCVRCGAKPRRLRRIECAHAANVMARGQH